MTANDVLIVAPCNLQLLDVRGNTPAEIALVNTLCWAGDASKE